MAAGTNEDGSEQRRVRREPPPFRRVTVRSVEDVTPRLRRVALGGPALAGLEIPEPASSVRLLLPPAVGRELVMPTWTGNQFELPSGARAPIRTFTPRRLDRQALALTLEVVVHERGAASDWVRRAEPGAEVALSGPGRGDPPDPDAASYLLAGDETAIPAICQLLEVMPHDQAIDVHVEIADPRARLELPPHPGATVTWHELAPGAPPGSAFAAAVEQIPDLPERVWIAGEAAAVQRLRTHLFTTLDRPRSSAVVRGYWKHGRSAT